MKKLPLILHIGNHKTGTTTLQQMCFTNQERLRTHGLYWPERRLSQFSQQHSALAEKVMAGDMDFVKDYLNDADVAASKTHSRAILMSGENFCNMDREEINRFKALLGDRDVRILLVVRNIYDFLVSVLAQRMKRGLLLGNPPKKLTALHQKLDYAAVIEDWEQAFGEQAVEVYSYDEMKETLVPSFLAILGIEDVSDFEIPERIYNPSFPFPFMAFLHFSGVIEKREDYNSILKKLEKEPLPKTVWTPQLFSFARSLVLLGEADYTHPKLQPFLPNMVKKPTITEDKGAALAQVKVLASLLDPDDPT